MYIDCLMLLNFAVDFLLLLGTNRLSGYPPGAGRAALAACVGGIYGGICILPGAKFLGNVFWRLVFLGLMAWIAFGSGKGAVRRAVLFVFLCMALGGVASGLHELKFGLLILAAFGVWLMCSFGFHGKADFRRYVPVTLCHGEHTVKLTALVDTGNTLNDPITGESVLVAGAQVGQRLLGLNPKQLSDPVGTLTTAEIPGLRLLPYCAVGQKRNLLLAIRLERVLIGHRQTNGLVAFSPEVIGNGETFQALTGGEP